MQKEYTKRLQDTITNRKPLKVYLGGEYWCDMEYVPERNIYQGEKGCLSMEAIAKVMANEEEVSHLKLEVI